MPATDQGQSDTCLERVRRMTLRAFSHPEKINSRLGMWCFAARHIASLQQFFAVCAIGMLEAGVGARSMAAQVSLLPAVQPAVPLATGEGAGQRSSELIVGFMGGRIRADNLVHKEASIARDLQRRNPTGARVVVFANHDGATALKTVVALLDVNRDDTLSAAEKHAARIVIYGHSWGASETVNLARSLNAIGIPVLLTIQVDSVRKHGEDDAGIPPNVQLAVNFYQTEGFLRGRAAIHAQDPTRTRVLTNEEFHYKNSSVDTKQFPWFARTFMGPHIAIENDPRVWNRVEAMLQETIDGVPVVP